MVTIKTGEEIESLRRGGKILAEILASLKDMIVPGVHTLDLDDKARFLMKKAGAESAFLGYTPYGAKRPYPAAVCISINDEVVHGIPNENNRIINEGDIVSIDSGIIFEGLYTDSAITVGCGKIDAKAEKLLKTTEEAMMRGIDAAQVGKKTGDIGEAIEKYVKPKGFSLAENLGGHGVGYAQHEDPFVPNFGRKGQGVSLKPGMVIAIEPIVNEGTSRVRVLRDGYTYATVDKKRSAHFEHTVVITKKGPEILTTL